ncbi:signal peptidase I [Viridibacillus soli]|uniref:signal peptidase I n=1 Tax=Viridibacillus soli TaxID=2798301 RepID=UPI00389AA224
MKKENKKEFIEWIKPIVVAIIFALAIRTFIFTPIVVDGASMMPTYEDGDKVIVNKISKQIAEYERYDVIVFDAGEDNYIKRVIGLPGEHIAYKDDILYVNREPYVEPYLEEYKKKLIDGGTLTEDFRLEEYTGKLTIPDGYLFVVGDNRRHSSDSRDPEVGLIPMDKVLGKANIIFYPLDNIGIVK